MIYWFSGTGNSKYVARELSDKLNERISFIPHSDYNCDLGSENRLIFVFPIYSWGVPPIVVDFINNLNIIGYKNQYISMVCTCGDEVAKAPEMFINIMNKKGLEVSSIFSVIMPNNYVLLPGFSIDSKDIEFLKLNKCDKRIESISQSILNRKECQDVVRGSMPTIKTKLVYPLFKKWGVSFSKWSVTEKCISCGKCIQVCPVKNISFDKDKRPMWRNNCTSCVACYHFCPVNAIQYGKFTKGKGQYFFKDKD